MIDAVLMYNSSHENPSSFSSDPEWGKETIAQICKDKDGDIEATIMLNKIIHRKGLEELSIKHTFTMGGEADVHFEDLDGEVSNDELCVEFDKHIKWFSDCTTPVAYIRSIKDFEYKDFEKMCLQKLPEQQERMIACRK